MMKTNRRQLGILLLALLAVGAVLGLMASFSADVHALPYRQVADVTLLEMHFDGDVNDSSGNGLHGTWQGTERYTTGVSGQAIDLPDGSYVFRAHSDLLGGIKEVTVDVWAGKNTPDSAGTVVDKYEQYFLRVGGDSVTGYVWTESGNASAAVYNLQAVHDTQWHHYILAYDGAQVRVFVDDALVAFAPLTGTVTNVSSRDLYVGSDAWNNGFEGQIDELAIIEGAPDVDAPYIVGHDPAPGETWAPPDTDVVLHVRDDGKGVLQSSIAMTVEGSLIAPSITGAPSDYAVAYDPPAGFAYGQEVDVSISASDVESNTVQQDYSVTVRAMTDAIPPRGYFYVEDTGSVDVVIHSLIWDAESGMGPGAQMQFSNDGAAWTTVAYADTAAWTLASASGERTVYARYADVDGNWTAVLAYTLGGEPGVPFEITEHAPDAARLRWQTQPGVAEYVILRSGTLGWRGSINLTQDVSPGDTVIVVESTNGLLPGDEVHFGFSHTSFSRNDYYVESVVDGTHLQLTHPVPMTVAASSYPVSLSGCWVKDYSGYTEIATVTGENEYVDTGLALETDYFYVIGYGDGSQIISYSSPINVKLSGMGVLYDAALGASGGYIWKVTQNYGDTPALIDGDASTYEPIIQYNNPLITTSQPRYISLGFHRVNLNARMLIERIEISQDAGMAHVQAAVIMVGFDDRSTLTFDLENDPLVERVTQDDYRLYRIPVNKTSSYVSVYVQDVTNTEGNYTIWNKVGVYTSDSIADPVTSAVLVDSVDVEIDFSQPDGTLPTTFGTDEVYDNVEGYEAGWMLRSWPYTKDIFDLYRVQMGDFWPRGYGQDLIKIGELAGDISATDTSFTLQNADPYTNHVGSGGRLKIAYELMRFSSMGGDELAVNSRGYENTPAVVHAAGTPVYAYKSVGQILRLQEILPEFQVVKYADAYVSGIAAISGEPDPAQPGYVDLNDPIRTAVLTVVVSAGEYAPGDVIRIGREKFGVLAVDDSNPEQIRLTVQRGFDGTNQRYVQHNGPVRDVYKLLDYEPYYEGFKNDPTDPGNYFWDNFETSMDKLIKDGDAVPWFIVWSPIYATKARGRVAALETVTNPRGIVNNVIVDEFNSTPGNDGADWWVLIASGNDENDDQHIRGNMYEYCHAELHMLTGAAAGKVFYVRSHSGDRLRVVRTRDDSYWENEDPEYVDLYAEGVRSGDAYIVEHNCRQYGNVAPKYWQYNADIVYNISRFISDTYSAELDGRPFYLEYSNEPNLGTYGTWTKDAYIDSYNVLARTIREGRPGLGPGFSRDAVVVGAGSLAGGLNPGIPMPGTEGDYDIALSLIDRADYLDFVSHHRYYMGSRVQKRENSWEYWMVRSYAQSQGKAVAIIDSEDSVATAGGTGQEEARHWAQFGVPYWEANFINSYYGEYGELGRLDFIVHFRLYYANDQGLGMAAADENGDPILDLVYWPIQMYQDHTSTNRDAPDTMVRVVKGWDNYGWVQAMGTIHGETGEGAVHLVNKKGTPIVVDLTLLGAGDVATGTMYSAIGGGSNQTIGDGYHPLDYQGHGGDGAVIETWIGNFNAIVLEPYSANIVVLGVRPPQRLYLPLVMREN
jgi:hypothetical protein